MSKLKVNKKSTEVNEETLTQEESEVLTNDGENFKDAQSEVSSQRMQSVVELLQEEFDIKDKNFELTGYSDKGSKIEATLNNSEFEVKFTLKGSTLMRLYTKEN